jgi:hypothetical protein
MPAGNERNALMFLLKFAKKCQNAKKAKDVLEKAVQQRQMNSSYVLQYFQIPDIRAAIKAVDRQNEVAKEQAETQDKRRPTRSAANLTERLKRARDAVKDAEIGGRLEKRLRGSKTRSKKGKTGSQGNRKSGTGTRAGANNSNVEEDACDSRDDQNSGADDNDTDSPNMQSDHPASSKFPKIKNHTKLKIN